MGESGVGSAQLFSRKLTTDFFETSHDSEQGLSSRPAWHVPNGEPRRIEDAEVKPRIHESVIERKTAMSDYDPPNFPLDFDVEPRSPAAALA
jgi:hypothetical protein